MLSRADCSALALPTRGIDSTVLFCPRRANERAARVCDLVVLARRGVRARVHGDTSCRDAAFLAITAAATTATTRR